LAPSADPSTVSWELGHPHHIVVASSDVQCRAAPPPAVEPMVRNE
jgi:hypothetical protein